VSQRIPAGNVPSELQPGTAARIFTGAPIPPGADAVVMQEQCEAVGDEVRINDMPRAGQWVRRRGEDVQEGSTVLTHGQRLTPQALGMAASVGAATLSVMRRPRVALFSTGDELVMPGEPLRPGAIYNSNRYTLRALILALGGEVTDLGIVPDRLDATRDALMRAAQGHDLIVTSGGVSVGEEDHLRPAVQAEGRLDLWQIALKPGKPLAFGSVRRGASPGAARPGSSACRAIRCRASSPSCSRCDRCCCGCKARRPGFRRACRCGPISPGRSRTGAASSCACAARRRAGWRWSRTRARAC
jgi:molybdopterin molybdotransferase